MVLSVRALELARELKSDHPPRLLDVREVHELENSKIAGSVNIPMDELGDRISELDPSQEWVIVCRSGSRSASVTMYLMQMGFTKIRNFAGGMNSWVNDVDPSMKVY